MYFTRILTASNFTFLARWAKTAYLALNIKKNTVMLLLVIALFITLLGSDLNADLKYEISDLGITQPSEASCINNKGEVAGTILIEREYHVFKWSLAEGISILFQSDGEAIRGINESGQIIGNDSITIGWPESGYMWSSIKSVNSLGIHVCGINNLGSVCGCVYQYGSPERPKPAYYNSFSQLLIIDPTNDLGYQRASFQGRITGLNDHGTIVGEGSVLFRDKPFVKRHHGFLKYNNGSLVDLGPYRPVDINENNHVLLGSFPHGYKISIWDNGNIKDLWNGGFSTLPTSINNHGNVVGQKDNKAVLWKDGELFILEELIENKFGWDSLSEANDINDKGQIVGCGWHQGLYKAFLLTPIK